VGEKEVGMRSARIVVICCRILTLSAPSVIPRVSGVMYVHACGRGRHIVVDMNVYLTFVGYLHDLVQDKDN